MATIKQVSGAKTSLSARGFSNLANTNYCVSVAKNNVTNQPNDVIVQINVSSTRVPTGPKQVSIFSKSSFDNSLYQTGPETGTVSADEGNLTWLVSIPMSSSAVVYTRHIPIAPAYGGVLPPYFKIVSKADAGVSISGTIFTSEISNTVA